MTTATANITAQEAFDNAAEALRSDDVTKAMAWKDIGDGLVRLEGLAQAERLHTAGR